jgi:CheY-like chemotaxis protein
MMQDNSIQILLIEDNPGDARLVGEMLAATNAFQPPIRYQVQHVERLDQALAECSFDTINDLRGKLRKWLAIKIPAYRLEMTKLADETLRKSAYTCRY